MAGKIKQSSSLRKVKYIFADLYEERAAIKQYDAGLSIEEAENEAFIETMEEFKAEYPEATEEVLRDGINWYLSFMRR